MSTPVNPIRSFVRRSGRITSGQQRALTDLQNKYVIHDSLQPLVLDDIFGRQAPRCLEIGYGMGDALFSMANAHPEQDYLGIDVYLPGLGRLLNQVEKSGLTNVRVLCADAVEVLQHGLPECSLSQVYIFFPDPWPKKRHHKRRLIQSAFIELLSSRLQPGGSVWLATDWENYAEQMLDVFEASASFRNAAGKGQFTTRPAVRPLTKFEQRGQRLGHVVRDLHYINVSNET